MIILWFSNIEITQNISSTGTWIYTMANALVDSGKIELINITEGNVSELEYRDNGKLKQWIIPKSKLRNGLPNIFIIKEIVELVNQIKPDVVHIWGTENYWGLLFSRGMVKGNVIIDIQGLKFIWYKYFFSGLSYFDILKCIAFKDLLKPQFSIFGRVNSFKKWGEYELEIIKSIPHIGVQSNWVRAQISYINPEATLFTSKIQLRKPFLTKKKWERDNSDHFRIFTSTSAVLSYKGLHVLIEATNILKKKYIGVKLVIDGYI
jgi:glycosyltransferase involved in cell wall biosynthesis